MRRSPDRTRYTILCEGCGEEFTANRTQVDRGRVLCSNTCKTLRAERVMWDRIDATGICWEWTGATSWGYGQVKRRGRSRKVHRIVWEILVGPIPDGIVLDHLCRNTVCCNPDHLDPVTQRENTLRGSGKTMRRYRERVNAKA